MKSDFIFQKKSTYIFSEISFHFSKRNPPKFFKIDTFGKFFQKSCESGVFDFCWSGLQFVQNFKPIRQLLCTFSSCSVLSIYMIYNIYKFQGNQRPKICSFHFISFHHFISSFHFISFHSQLTLGSRYSYLAADD